MNKVILMGRLVRDPEIRYTTNNNNTLVATFALAVNRRFVKQGEERQSDFINIVAWDKTGEFVSKYFKKGQQVGVVGRLQTRQYDDKDGKRVYVTEVVAEEVYFVGDKKEESQNVFDNANTPASSTYPATIKDDDLPF